MVLTKPAPGATGWNTSVDPMIDRHNANPPKLVGRRLACMGDSNSANGNNPALTLAGTHGKTTAVSYLTWAVLLSGGRLSYAGAYATGGQSSTYILNTHLPQVIAAAPDACYVQAGTNDPAASVPYETTIANLTAMIEGLLGAGILPILGVLPPRPSTDNGNFQRTNHWIRRTALRRGLPLVDTPTVLAQPNGAWITAYNLVGGDSNPDGIHWNAAGAKQVGQLLATEALARLGGSNPPLHTVQAATDSTRLVTNPLMLTDTNSDGVPDGWTASGSPTVALAADGSTPPAPRVATRGQMFSLTRTAADGSAVTATIPVTAGNRYILAAHLEATVEASGGSASLRFPLSDYSADLYGFETTMDIPSGAVLLSEVVIPAGKTGILARLDAKTASGAQIKAGQVTVLDVTAQAL